MESITKDAETSKGTSLEGLYLTFRLGEEVYGLRILTVQEIIQLLPTTVVPRTPEYIRGVINLRGRIIPVVDLRTKFGMEAIDDSGQTCIVVVEIETSESSVTMGVVVDQVSEVTDIKADQIEPPPRFGVAVETGFLLGMGKVGDKVIILLDIQQVLTIQDIQALENITASQ